MKDLRSLLTLVALTLIASTAAAESSGTVIDSDGAAIEGASVVAYAPESSEQEMARWLSDEPARTPLAAAKSDSRGRFSLDVPKGAVLELEISAAGCAVGTARLTADPELGAFALPAAEPFHLEIRDGTAAIAGALVITNGRLHRTGEDGRVSIPVAGRWSPRLLVVQPGYAPVAQAPQPVASAARRIELGKGSAIEGVVTRAGRPAAGAVVSIDGLPVATSGDDGTFVVPPGPEGWSEITAASGDEVAAATRLPKGGRYALELAKGAVVAGSVVDGPSNSGLADAVVTLRPANDRRRFTGSDAFVPRAVSDARGQFAIGPLPSGRYVLEVARPGHRMPSVTVDARAGERITRSIAGEPQATIVGTVVDEEKRGVAGAVVSIETELSQPRFRMATGLPARSAPDGRFVMREVPPDREIRLEASRRGLPSGSSDAMTLGPAERKSGVTLVIPRGFEISGIAVDRDENPVAGATVTAEPSRQQAPGMIVMRRMLAAEGEDSRGVLTARDGTFRMRLARGKHDLTVSAEGWIPRLLRAVEIEPGLDPLRVEMTEGVSITGRVVRADGTGAPDVSISVMSNEPRSGGPVVTGPDGGFVLGGLPQGVVRIFASKPDEHIREMKTLEAPAAGVLIELPPGGALRGRVVEKETKRAVTDFSAGLSGERRGAGGMMVMRGPQVLRPFRTEDGSFELQNVPAGGGELIVESPGFVTARVPVEVEEGKTLEDVEVALERGTTIVGKVTGPDGAPLAGVSIGLGGETRNLMIPQIAPQRGTSSDAAGEYRLEGVAAGEHMLRARKDGYQNESRTLQVEGSEMRVDLRLSRGEAVTGVVVTESGMPVADASVTARSAVQDGTARNTKTDANGAFRLDGLTPGRYTFAASREGYARGEVRDVDVSVPSAVRITLSAGGTISGRIFGLSAAEMPSVQVSARGAGGFASSSAAHDGTFRIEGAPAGTLQVQARVQSMGSSRSSPVRTVELPAGSEARVDLDFDGGHSIRGRVTRGGAPVEGASVSFMPRDRTVPTSGSARTGANGEYEVAGLESGVYAVRAIEMNTFASYETECTVTGHGTFDIRMSGTMVRGRVVDAETSEPVADAMVILQEGAARSMMRFAMPARTDAAGGFFFESISPGSYQARTEKEGYGQSVVDVNVGESEPPELEIRIRSSAGVSVRLVDARDGRALQGRLSVADAMGRVAWEGLASGGGADGTRISLAPGSYQALVNVNGYAPVVVDLAAPSAQTRTVPLTPGGSLRIESSAPARRLARILDASGRVFRRFSWLAPAEMLLEPGTTVIEAIAPGAYSIEVLDGGSVASRESFTILEGQTTVLRP
ncbi:MAG TPA: carboxypeptidase regulatory-like domain-containing protein [Thermoanaerobaculia bacterium]|nr:carboxypeptidase regulatory-like domain-containing protein [Thermoanaerobaculia bacterium]